MQQTPKYALLKSSMTLVFVLTLCGTKGNEHQGDICIDNMTVRRNAFYDFQRYVRERDCLFLFYLCIVHSFRTMTRGLTTIIDKVVRWDDPLLMREHG